MRGQAWRTVAVWGAVSAGTGGLALLCLPLVRGAHAVSPLRFEDVLVQAMAALALLALARVWWATTVTVSGLLRGTLTGSPSGLTRRLVVLACGGVLAAAAAAPANAAPPEGSEPAGTRMLHGLPFPERATADSSARTPRALPRTAAPSAGASHYEVRPGDSLWSIATGLTGAEDPVLLDRTWRRIHRLNHDTVGTDPDLIHPGQSLRLPRTDATDDSAPAHHQGDHR